MIQKIREATGLLTANLVLFSSMTLTVWLPASILLVYLRLYVFPETAQGDELRAFAQEVRVSNAIEVAFSPVYTGAILYAVSQLKQGVRATYRESMAHGARRSFKLLGTRIGTGLLVLLGLLAFIVPGIFLALRFALVDAVVVLDGVAGGSARKLSTELTQGKRWNIALTMFLAYLVAIIAIFLETLILYLPLSFIGQDENFVVAVINECISRVLLVLPVIVLFLLYRQAKRQQTVPLQEDHS